MQLNITEKGVQELLEQVQEVDVRGVQEPKNPATLLGLLGCPAGPSKQEVPEPPATQRLPPRTGGVSRRAWFVNNPLKPLTVIPYEDQVPPELEGEMAVLSGDTDLGNLLSLDLADWKVVVDCFQKSGGTVPKSAGGVDYSG